MASNVAEYVAHEEAYVAFCESRMRVALLNQAKEVRALEQKLAITRARLQSPDSSPEKWQGQSGAFTQVIQFAAQLETHKINIAELKLVTAEDHARRYGLMCDVPRVKSIQIHSSAVDELLINTDVLYGKSSIGSWHRVGRFTARVNLSARTPTAIQFTNVDGPRKSMQGPTGIDLAGRVSCYGTALADIRAALEYWDDVQLVQILVRYPECPGQFDTIRNWPEVPHKEVPAWYIKQFGR